MLNLRQNGKTIKVCSKRQKWIEITELKYDVHDVSQSSPVQFSYAAL